MNAFAIFAVNEHLEFLLDEAAKRRDTQRTSPSFGQRIGSALASVRKTLTSPADYSASILPPRLDDYPYQG